MTQCVNRSGDTYVDIFSIKNLDIVSKIILDIQKTHYTSQYNVTHHEIQRKFVTDILALDAEYGEWGLGMAVFWNFRNCIEIGLYIIIQMPIHFIITENDTFHNA